MNPRKTTKSCWDRSMREEFLCLIGNYPRKDQQMLYSGRDISILQVICYSLLLIKLKKKRSKCTDTNQLAVKRRCITKLRLWIHLCPQCMYRSCPCMITSTWTMNACKNHHSKWVTANNDNIYILQFSLIYMCQKLNRPK